MSDFTHITPDSEKKLRFTEAGSHVVFLQNVSGEVEIDIAAAGAKVYIFGLYTGRAADSFTLRTIQHHTAPDTWSDLLIKGVFDDQSTFSYSGLVRIERHCNGSHAYQKNQNIMLSKRAKVASEPNLEILSNDVFCTHGSTTGTINKDTIYYMQTRGLAQKEARDMYVKGFIEDLMTRVQELVPGFTLPH